MFEGIDLSEVVIVLLALLLLALQLLLCFKVKSRLLRLLPVLLCVLAGIFFFVMMFIAEGWDVLGYLLLLLLAAIFAAACVIAWMLWGIAAIIKGKKKAGTQPKDAEEL